MPSYATLQTLAGVARVVALRTTWAEGQISYQDSTSVSAEKVVVVVVAVVEVVAVVVAELFVVVDAVEAQEWLQQQPLLHCQLVGQLHLLPNLYSFLAPAHWYKCENASSI